MKRAVIITRVSSNEQVKGTSPKTQTEACLAFAKTHGYEVDAVLHEDGVPGGVDLTGRPIPKVQWERLQRGEIAAIIFFDLDRAGRTLKTAEIIEESTRYGDGILLVKKPPVDDVIGQVISLGAAALVAKVERYITVGRSVRGKRDIAQQGGYSGGRHPFWLIPPNNKKLGEQGNGWKLDKKKAAIVRLMFDLALNGDPATGEPMGALRICNYLDEKGYPTPRGLRRWRIGPVQRILHNEAAYGRYVQCRGDHTTLSNAEEPIAVEVPPVVSRAQWDAVQRRVKQWRNYRGVRTKHDWLLAGGLLRCSEDAMGYRCNGKAGGRRSYYCPGRTGRVKSGCSATWISADWIEAQLAERLHTLLADPGNTEIAVRAYLESLQRQRDDLTADVGPVQKKLEEIGKRRQRLLAAYADGMAEAEYQQRRRDLDAEATRLEAQTAGRADSMRRLKALERNLGEIRAALDAGTLKADLTALGRTLRQVFYTAHRDGQPVEPQPERLGDIDDGFSDWAVTYSEADPDDVRVDRRHVQVTTLRELMQRLKMRLTVYPDGHVEAEGLIPIGEFSVRGVTPCS